MAKRVLIGEELVRKGIITPEQLKEALEEHKRTNTKIGEVLVKKGFATESDVARVLSDQLGFPFVELETFPIDQKITEMIPRNIAERFMVIAIRRDDDVIDVAVADPFDLAAVDEITRITGGAYRIRSFVATASSIRAAVNKFYGASAVMPRMTVGSFGTKSVRPAGAHKPTDKEEIVLQEEAEQAPVIKLVNSVIEEAVRNGASDIHLEPEKKVFHCRMRVDGILHDGASLPVEFQRAVISRIKIMANMNIAQSRMPQDGRIEMFISGRAVDLRVAVLPTIYGEHVAIRILDKSRGVIKLDELGFSNDVFLKIKEIINKPYGIILVTGPTGSGKSTTLYAVLNQINDLKKNIVTLEDPIEYTISRVNQCQVNVKAGLTFAAGLRSIVRLDPDIIMVGEIRDKETADIAVRSALTGHLVFSTLHTNDAPSAATRLVDIGIESYLVSSSIIGVLAQRLVRKLCPKCKEAYKLSPEELGILETKNYNVDMSGVTVFRAKGCAECRNIGYKGRTSIFELMIPDEKIRELIVNKAPAYAIKEASRKIGMRTLCEDGLEKVKQGLTSLEEIIRVAEEM